MTEFTVESGESISPRAAAVRFTERAEFRRGQVAALLHVGDQIGRLAAAARSLTGMFTERPVDDDDLAAIAGVLVDAQRRNSTAARQGRPAVAPEEIALAVITALRMRRNTQRGARG